MGKYIVTGGCGFIGSHIVRALLAVDHNVIIVDDLSSGLLENINTIENKKMKFLQLDITDWVALSRNFAAFQGADGIFHAAAQARIQPSIFNPLDTHRANVLGTMNVLEMMRMLGINKIVYSGSSSSYGPSDRANVESDSPKPQNPYALTKCTGEMYCKTWGRIYGMKNVCLRYFNVYGERSPLSGPYAPVIGLFFRQALVGDGLMTMVGDGSQKRDFTEVSDVVAANLIAMEKCGRKNINGETFNVGTGKNYSIYEVTEMMKRVFKSVNLSPISMNIDARPGEVQEVLADVTKVKKCLGWEAKVDLEDGIRKLVPYYMNYFANRR